MFRSRLTRLATIAAAIALVPTLAFAQGRPMTDVKFSLDFAFGGPQSIFTLAADKGYFAAEGLNVTIDRGAGSGDAVNRVANRSYDLAWGDINVMIRFNAQNPTNPVTAFLITYDAAPHSIVTLKGRGITSPKDLEGKKLAAPELDAGRQMLPLFARAVGLDMSKMVLNNVDIRLRESTVFRGDNDGATGFYASVFYNLVGVGVKPEDIIAFKYKDFGVDLFGSAVYGRPEYIERNPNVIRGFTRATIKAIADSIRDPVESVASAKKRDATMDDKIELERLKITNQDLVLTPNVRRNGIGSVDIARLERAIKMVADVYSVAPPSLASVYNATFLPPAAERAIPPGM